MKAWPENALGFVYSAARDAMQIQSEGEAPRRTYTENWHELRLLESDVVELVGEIDALAVKYAMRQSPRGKNYVVHSGLAPEPKLRNRSAPNAP